MRLHLALLLPVLLMGCEELGEFVPTVSFDRFDVKEIDFEHFEADFVFQVDNPNPVDIKLASFSYDLGFEQISLLSGDDSDGFELQAVGSSELALPVGMAWRDAWDLVQATRGEDEIDFSLAGDFGFDTPIGLAELPYAEDGRFPAVRTPKFRFERLRVTRLDLFTQTATVQIDLGVDNDHGSSLFFQAFDYDLALGGKRVASGTVAELGDVDGATEGTLVLPVDIDLVGVGATVISALTGGGRLDVGLDATMDVDTPFGVLPLSIDETGNVRVE